MTYEEQAQKELLTWQKKMARKPSLLDKLSKKIIYFIWVDIYSIIS